jgi:hypothetical protein
MYNKRRHHEARRAGQGKQAGPATITNRAPQGCRMRGSIKSQTEAAMSRLALSSRILFKPVAATLLALALAACAQTREPGYYTTEHDTTQSDARMQAQGRHTAKAPSQIQLGFGDQAAARPGEQAPDSGAAASEPTRVRALAEAKTFLGTVPCLANEGADCPASRISLTLAPTGEWRARIQELGPGAAADRADKGGWEVIGAQPTRILLRTGNGENAGSRADLTFVNDNVLRINMFNNIQPMLEYRLTRQANVDPINELADKTPLACG